MFFAVKKKYFSLEQYLWQDYVYAENQGEIDTLWFEMV
jgi:hypothetical protein